jgi:TetR/AcrR family transcriptional regulator, cholesterol catabolism regulator
MDIKERISVKAHELFMRFGFRSVSMDDIANHLGMSKKTLYQYFTDKDALVDAVLDSEMCDTEADCKSMQLDADNAVHELLLTMDEIHEQFSNMNPMVLYDLEKFHPKAWQKFLKHKNQFLYKIIRDNIERGIREELYRPEINVDVMSRFRLESMMVLFNVDMFPPNKYNLGVVTQETMEHYLYGLANLKGHKLIIKYKEERLKKTTDEKHTRK